MNAHQRLRNALLFFAGVFFVDFFAKRVFMAASRAEINIGFGPFGSVSPFFVLAACAIAFFFFLAMCVCAYQGRAYGGLLLVSTGAFSNLVDRLLLGGVIDYIPLSFFAVNANFSDIMIAGGLVVLLTSLRGKLLLSL